MSRSSEQVAPLPHSFPKYPASWYPICRAKDLKDRPLTRRMLGKDLAVFRTGDGEVSVLAAHCSHMGANLAGGCVKGKTLQCPYHGWRYDTSGACVEIPGQTSIPAGARQKAFPAVEKYGYIFFFNGSRALFELPFFEGDAPEDFHFGGEFEFNAASPWYLLGAHAFDVRHLEFVHDRKLKGPLRISEPTPYARCAAHDSEVCGTGIYDRILRVAVGKDVKITMEPYGGVFILVTGDFGKLKSRFFLMVIPQEDGTSVIQGLIAAPRLRFKMADLALKSARLRVRRVFTRGYLLDEVNRLGSHSYRPEMLGSQDQQVIDYLCWLTRISAPPSVSAGSPKAAPLPIFSPSPAETRPLEIQ